LQKPSKFSTELINDQALVLLSRVFDAFSLHPFFYILNLNMKTGADPPALPFAHQVELLFRLAFRKPVRALIADEIGLGKTIEAILTVKMLEERDGVKRVLLLVPRILVEQWRSELNRFGIRAEVIERNNISVLEEQGFPAGWYIASIDLVKREEYRPRVTSVNWDVVVVDEAHRVGKIRSGQRSVTQRYELVEKIASNARRNIILLSATPHRGHVTDYISRLKLLDPYLVDESGLDNDEFYRLTRNAVVFRRTKMDVNQVYERKEVFKKARFVARVIDATEDEKRFNERLFEFLRSKLVDYYERVGEEPKALSLLLATVAKRASSSPYAAMVTLERMLRARSLVVEGKAATLDEARKLDKEAESIIQAYFGLGFEDYGEAEEETAEPDEVLNKFVGKFVERCGALLEERDRKVLKELLDLAKTIVERKDSRLKGVLKLIQEHINNGDKVVVFTEYKDTAKYIYNRLKEELPEIFNTTALVTSEGIVIRGLKFELRQGIEDLKRYLRLGQIKLVISTDVASEGLNLQAANILINYEPSWSPVKVEQRLGRVWRLGQERDVVSYTLFLAVQSDRDVLDVLYKKLLAWGRSLQESRVAIGEEVLIDMMSEEGSITIPVEEAKGVPKYSEYKALLTYIQKGRDGLEEYIQSIISALVSLRKNLEKVGLARRDVVARIERLLSETLGDFRGDEVVNTFKELVLLVARLKWLNAEVRGNKVYIETERLGDIHEFYKAIASYLRSSGGVEKPVYVVSSASIEGLKELHLFKLTVLFKDKPVYSETVGVGIKNSSIVLIRGRKLLDIIVKALQPNHVLSSAEEYYIPDKVLQNLKLRTKGVMDNIVERSVDEIIKYITELEKKRFAFKHEYWEPENKGLYGYDSKYLGAIIFTLSTPSVTTEARIPSPIEIKKVEEEAMRISMEYEKNRGRVPKNVSMEEHFDILSWDPSVGEFRYIEVKGRSGMDLEVELTEPEFRVAEEKGEKYWLYIVYGIGTEQPRLLAIRNPVKNMRWEELSIKRYRLKPK